jgi:hypothetical protein
MKLLSAALLLLAFPSFSQEKVELRWKWQKGQEVVYKSMNRTLMQFGGQPIDQQMGYTTSMTATEVSESGEAAILVKYLAVVAKGVGPGGEFEYDSEKDKEPPADGPAAIQARMVGQSFTMKMNPRGRVTEVQGYDKVLEAMMKGAGDEAGPMKAQLKQLFTNDTFKGMMQQQIPPLPEGKMAKGDSWTNDFTVKAPMIGGLKFATKAKLSELQGNDATIDQDIEIKMVGGDDNKDQPVRGPGGNQGRQGQGLGGFLRREGLHRLPEVHLEMTFSISGRECP